MVRAQQSIALELPAGSDRASEARKTIGEFADAQGCERQAVELAVGEAFGNAVLHAYRGRPPGTVTITARVEAGELEVVITDDGIGMSPNPDSKGLGFGLPLIARYSDRLEIAEARGGGTEVRMSFRVDPGERETASRG
jgi:stage II sporulation protein AB (anti-sigma F factor)